MAINRQLVFDKYDGHCAYCGEVITIGNFQVDHIRPQFGYVKGHSKCNYDLNGFDNLNPACRSCNHHKKTFSIEGYRHELQMQVSRIRSTQFKRALKYGQVKITESPIVFYFEECILMR